MCLHLNARVCLSMWLHVHYGHVKCDLCTHRAARNSWELLYTILYRLVYDMLILWAWRTRDKRKNLRAHEQTKNWNVNVCATWWDLVCWWDRFRVALAISARSTSPPTTHCCVTCDYLRLHRERIERRSSSAFWSGHVPQKCCCCAIFGFKVGWPHWRIGTIQIQFQANIFRHVIIINIHLARLLIHACTSWMHVYAIILTLCTFATCRNAQDSSPLNWIFQWA